MFNAAANSSLRTFDYGSTQSSSDVSEDTPILSGNCEESISADLEQTTIRGYQLMEETTAAGQHATRFTASEQRFSRLTVDHQAPSGATRPLERLEYFLNALAQMLIGFVTIYMSWFCLSKGLRKTALHAWLVTIGFVLLMAEGIMCHYKANVFTSMYKRNTKTTIHWLLQALGGSLGLTGVLVKCIQKGFLLSSLHGKLGFSAFVICLFALLSGLSALFSMRVKRFLSPLRNKALHNLLGIAAFVLAMCAQFTGYQTGFFHTGTTQNFRNTMQGVTAMCLLLSCIGPLKALSSKIGLLLRQLAK